MGDRIYRVSVNAARFARRRCLEVVQIGPAALADPSSRLLAVTHQGHLEPVLISMALERPVHWVARRHLFRGRVRDALMRSHLAVPVDLPGEPAYALRNVIDLLRRGRTVGIFPEGAVKRGDESCLRGGPIYGGTCLVSIKAQVPIVPVAVYGIEQLRRVRSFLPFQRTRVVIATGAAVAPPAQGEIISAREARRELGERLSRAFVELHASTRAGGTLNPAWEPDAYRLDARDERTVEHDPGATGSLRIAEAQRDSASKRKMGTVASS